MAQRKPILIEHSCEFKRSQFNTAAGKAWDVFFKILQPDFNIAHWVIDGYSCGVRLTGRNIDIDEMGPDWSISAPIMLEIHGFFELPGPEELPSEELLQELDEWVVSGILKSFNLKHIQSKYLKSGLSEKGFAIVTCANDEGITYDDLTVIWSNSKKMTAANIKARQVASRKKKRRVAKKK